MEFEKKLKNNWHITSSLASIRLSGPDEIYPSLLKMVDLVTAQQLATVFFYSIISGQINGDWRQAVVAPLHKIGSHVGTCNYCPTILATITCNVLKIIVSDVIVGHLLHDAQCGFSNGRSSMTNFRSALNTVTQLRNNGKVVKICFLEFSKVFDFVNHRFLYAKLTVIGVSLMVLVGLIVSWLSTHCAYWRYDLRAS